MELKDEHQQQAEQDAARRLLFCVNNRVRGTDANVLKEAKRLLKEAHDELKKGQWLK